MTSAALSRSSSKRRKPFAPNSLPTLSRASGRGSAAATSSTRLSRASVGAVRAKARPSPTTPSLSFFTTREYDLLRRLSKREAQPRRERPALPRRRRRAHGRHHAQPLAAGLPLRRSRREGRRAGSLPAPGRGSYRLQGFSES